MPTKCCGHQICCEKLNCDEIEGGKGGQGLLLVVEKKNKEYKWEGERGVDGQVIN